MAVDYVGTYRKQLELARAGKGACGELAACVGTTLPGRNHFGPVGTAELEPATRELRYVR